MKHKQFDLVNGNLKPKNESLTNHPHIFVGNGDNELLIGFLTPLMHATIKQYHRKEDKEMENWISWIGNPTIEHAKESGYRSMQIFEWAYKRWGNAFSIAEYRIRTYGRV